MNDPALSLLGFAAKAGKLSFGTHATEFAIESEKAKLVVLTCDLSEKSIKEIKFKASKKQIPVIILKNTDKTTLSGRLGKNCGIVAVNDDGFASAVLKKQEEIAHDGEI
jgi:ribosomal protein L7Ae-like RNA K-turn-binding protein